MFGAFITFFNESTDLIRFSFRSLQIALMENANIICAQRVFSLSLFLIQYHFLKFH
jgi:hypothetical protein